MWAPYYTLHKVLVGLLDQHDIAGSTRALELAVGLAGYVGARVIGWSRSWWRTTSRRSTWSLVG